MLDLDPIIKGCFVVTIEYRLLPCSQFCNFARSLFKCLSVERHFDECELAVSPQLTSLMLEELELTFRVVFVPASRK